MGPLAKIREISDDKNSDGDDVGDFAEFDGDDDAGHGQQNAEWRKGTSFKHCEMRMMTVMIIQRNKLRGDHVVMEGGGGVEVALRSVWGVRDVAVVARRVMGLKRDCVKVCEGDDDDSGDDDGDDDNDDDDDDGEMMMMTVQD